MTNYIEDRITDLENNGINSPMAESIAAQIESGSFGLRPANWFNSSIEATEMTNLEDVKELAAMVLELRSDLDVLADAMRSLEKDNGGVWPPNPADLIPPFEDEPDDDKRTEALRIIQTWAACDSESSETREEAMAAIVCMCESALS